MSSSISGQNRGERPHTPRPYQPHPRARGLSLSLSTTRLWPTRRAQRRPVPAFLARGQTGPVQSPRGAGRARRQLGSRTPVRLPGWAQLRGARKTRECDAPRTPGERGPRLPSPTVRAGCARPGGAARPGEGRPRRRREPPGSADAREQRQAPGAQGAGGRGRSDARGVEGGGRGSRSPALLRTHLGSGRPPRARASCRSLGPSCPSPCLCLLCAPTSRPRNARSTRTAPGEGDAPQVWSEGSDRVWEKFVPRGGRERARPG